MPHVSRLTSLASHLLCLTTEPQRTPRAPKDWSFPGLSHLTPHASHLTPHTSRLTPHTSRLSPHASRLSPHASTSIPPSTCSVEPQSHRGHRELQKTCLFLDLLTSRLSPHASRLSPRHPPRTRFRIPSSEHKSLPTSQKFLLARKGILLYSSSVVKRVLEPVVPQRDARRGAGDSAKLLAAFFV